MCIQMIRLSSATAVCSVSLLLIVVIARYQWFIFVSQQQTN